MYEIKEISFRLKIHSLIFTLFILFFLIDLVYGNVKFYYLHVSSFKEMNKATQFAKNLQKFGLEMVVRGEEVANKGFWYRIYIGPFYSRLEAELKSRELKEKGITDYAAVHKKDSLLSSNIEKKPEPIDKGAKAIPEEIVTETPPPPEVAPPVGKPPPETPMIERKSLITEHYPAKAPPPTKEKKAMPKTPPPIEAKKFRRVHPRTTPRSLRKGYGRNIDQGGFAVCIKHTYREIQTQMTGRKTFGGIPQAFNKYDFPTSMHMTILCLHLGLTDYFEIFADAGSAYYDLSDMGFVYGGGVRLNLFEVRGYKFKGGFYSALQGEYLGGKFKEEYKSDAGNMWDKDTDWQEFTGRVELGVTHSIFTAYLGGIYFLYNEDTERRQQDSILVYEDDLEGRYDFGAYGGAAIHLTPKLIVNLEGQVLSQDSIFLALEYLF